MKPRTFCSPTIRMPGIFLVFLPELSHLWLSESPFSRPVHGPSPPQAGTGQSFKDWLESPPNPPFATPRFQRGFRQDVATPEPRSNGVRRWHQRMANQPSNGRPKTRLRRERPLKRPAFPSRPWMGQTASLPFSQLVRTADTTKLLVRRAVPASVIRHFLAFLHGLWLRQSRATKLFERGKSGPMRPALSIQTGPNEPCGPFKTPRRRR